MTPPGGGRVQAETLATHIISTISHNMKHLACHTQTFIPADTIHVHIYIHHIYETLSRSCFFRRQIELGERKSDVSERYEECLISQNQLSGSRGLKHV